jgi:hypothetical protein
MQHEAVAGGGAERFGQEHHRRNPHAAADQQRPPARRGRERLADRPHDADGLARPARGQQREALADGLEQELDHAGAGIGAHQGKGPAHRQQRVAGHVREAARAGARRALRRDQAHDVLLAGPGLDVEDFRILDEDRAAVRSLDVRAGLSHESSPARSASRPCARPRRS